MRDMSQCHGRQRQCLSHSNLQLRIEQIILPGKWWLMLAVDIIWLPEIKAVWRFIFHTGSQLTGWQVRPGQIRMIISSASGSHRGNNVLVHHKHQITSGSWSLFQWSYEPESIWRMVSIVHFASSRSLICNPSTQKIHPPPVTKQE